jgi:hypothetical protein
MDLFKFIDIVTSKKLTLANLTIMQDPYDGLLHESIKFQFVDVNGNPSETELESESDQIDAHKIINDSTRQSQFISCWHENEYESAGMWDLYGSQNGIAIKTSVGRLKKSIQYSDYTEMDLLKVNYYKTKSDYFIPNREANHIYTGLLNKRISFEHEKEVRLIWHPRDYENRSPIRKINVILEELIECVYVSPLYDTWQLNSIKEMINQLGIKVEIKKSDLYELK